MVVTECRHEKCDAGAGALQILDNIIARPDMSKAWFQHSPTSPLSPRSGLSLRLPSHCVFLASGVIKKWKNIRACSSGGNPLERSQRVTLVACAVGMGDGRSPRTSIEPNSAFTSNRQAGLAEGLPHHHDWVINDDGEQRTCSQSRPYPVSVNYSERQKRERAVPVITRDFFVVAVTRAVSCFLSSAKSEFSGDYT